MNFLFGYIVLAILGFQVFCDVSLIEERRFPNLIDDLATPHLEYNSSLSKSRKSTLSAEYCGRNSDGFYPNVDLNCQSYYICNGGGGTLEMSCPQDFMFDYETCSCRDKKDVICCPESKFNSSCKAPAVMTSPEVANPEELRKGICKELGEGWYPEFSNGCHTFFNCKSRHDSHPVVLPCPAGMQFSSDACTCVTSDPSVPCDPEVPIKPCFIPEFAGCKALSPGAYVSYMSDCERYFMCSPFSLETYFFDCPNHQKFDVVSCTCLPERSVECNYCASLKPCYPPPPTLPPTQPPTLPPTRHPTLPPTRHPTRPPTRHPTLPPTRHPTRPPTRHPTLPPTRHPTRPPTRPPTRHPTRPPTRHPTLPPTRHPTLPPTRPPTRPPPPTLPPTPPPGTCTGKNTGLYPYFDSSCQCYYGCVKGVDHTYSYMCPPFFQFDVDTCSCLPGYLMHCTALDEARGCVAKPPTTVSTPPPPTTPFSDFCTGKGPGYYADLNRDCEWYFVCMGGEFQTTQFHCPSDLRFNHYTCECEYPYTVPCTIFDAGPCFPKTTTLAPTRPTRRTPPPDPDHFCKGKVPGFYIDDTKACNFYYLCVPDNPKPYIFQCDLQKRFDLELKECIWREDYHC